NDLPDEHAFKRVIGDKHFDVTRLYRLYEIIKKEEIDITQIVERIKHYVHTLMEHDEDYINKRVKHTRQLKAPYFTDRAKFIRNIEAIESFDRYVGKMHAAQLIDFTDMLIEVKKAFNIYPDLLAKYQEQYLYFLVDEYQDTNKIQNTILMSLCAYWERPNLFVVGDDDQAIFRFQGADTQNLLALIQKYPSIELICISGNYRSTQSILHAANHIIENMKSGRISSFQLEVPPEQLAKINKKLIAARPHPYDHPPSTRRFINTQQETLAVYEFIKNKWIQSPTSISDIAIIVRRNKTINDLTYLLELDGIPLNLKNGKDILQEPFIQHIILLLRYLNAEYFESQSGEPYLIQLLYLPYWGLCLNDVAKIAFLERKTRENKNLAEKILSPEAWPLALFENKKSIERFILNTHRWIQHLPPTQALLQIVEDIVRESGLMQWALNSKDRNWHLRSLNSFFQFIQHESYSVPHVSLTNLLDKIKKMEDYELIIPVEAGYASDKGVNILTAHGAKGLEFETVWIMNVVDSEWEKYGANSDTPYKLPKTVRQVDQTPDTKLYDERRLFYVAMTRAKRNLIISWSNSRAENQLQNESQFVTELADFLNIESHETQKVSDDLLNKKISLIQNRNITPPALLDHDLIDEFLKSFVMSSTELNLYLNCPRKFYFEEILKVPQAPNAHQGLGLSIHDALHQFFFHALSQTTGDFDAGRLVQLFKTSLEKNEWYFTRDEYEGLIRGFSNQLPLFLKENLRIWQGVEKFKLEYFLDRINFNGIPINGKIDQVIMIDGKSIIIDFKSGKGDSTSSTQKVKKPWKGNNGGDYWRQGAFYRFLLDADTSTTWNVQKSSFLFLQPNKLDPHNFKHEEY
ncbi:MAG: ATP-dependent DNA helicase, partial [Saprospiraceae bacterium]